MHSRDERHFHVLFEYAPISLWEEDYSGIKQGFECLREQGVRDLQEHLDQHPQIVDEIITRIKVVDVNLATLAMFGATTKEELLTHLDDIFRDEMRLHFRAELLALWQGDVTWSGEGINYTLQGEPVDIRLYWRILPGHETHWDRVLVTIENITARQRAERALEASEARFRSLFDYAPISLWEQDYRALKVYFDGLRQQGVADLRAYLTGHPEAVKACMGMIRVLDVNKQTLQLFGASSKEELLANLGRVFRDDMGIHFVDELVDIWNGKTAYGREGINYSLAGNPINIYLDWRLMPGHEDDFGWALVAIQDITARKKAEDYLRYLGTHDVMTGLYNRAYFEETLARLETERRDPVTIVMVDLNGLKRVNDTFGHQAGDNLIRRAAEVLKASFDEQDIVARIGGDEFVVILPDADPRTVDDVRERLESLVVLNNKYYREPELSISLGASISRPDLPLEKVVGLADDAMYDQKGRHYHRREGD